MKLRNKKTGKIVTCEHIGLNNDIDRSDGTDEDVFFTLKENRFSSLAELCDKFEDAPEERKTWAEKVKIRELPSGLKIADRDYYEIDEDGDKKTEFTWDEAMERFKDDPNWRLPTPKELNQMVLDLGYNDEGVFEGEIFAKNLGEDSLEAYKENDDYGYYWSSTPYSSVDARSLAFSSTNVYPQNFNYKTYGFTVRCVAR